MQQRYGKWKAAEKQVIDELEKYGAEGLELFGYFEDGDADHIKSIKILRVHVICTEENKSSS